MATGLRHAPILEEDDPVRIAHRGKPVRDHQRGAAAREKIESAGGTVQVIEIATSLLAALGVERPADAD